MTEISALEQAVYDAVRGETPAKELRPIITRYLLEARPHRAYWKRLKKHTLFLVVRDEDRPRPEEIDGAVVVILANPIQSADMIAKRCKKVRELGAAYIFVMLPRIIPVNESPLYLPLCDGLYITLPWVGEPITFQEGVHALRTNPPHLMLT